MSDTSTSSTAAPGHDAHGHSSDLSAYWMVFGALIVCTLSSFVANYAARAEIISVHASFVIILLVSVLKATLVATIFMHLKYDWGKVYIMIVPALILGPLLVIVLLPD